MFILTKEFNFEAAHRLTKVPKGHPCAKLHGHSYRVQFVLSGSDLGREGFLYDYRKLDSIKKYLDTIFDHQDLNGVLPAEFKKMLQKGSPRSVLAVCIEPTAENLACFLFKKFEKELTPGGERFSLLDAVRVSETAKTWAEYRHDSH